MPNKKSKKKKKVDKNKAIRTLYTELERLNTLLEELKEEKIMLMKTALKATERQKKAEELLSKK